MKLPHQWSWLREYTREDLRGDLSGGLAVGVMLIPHAMAVALIGGLPPIVGLYAAVGSLVMYTLLATSRRLTVGPVALDSLLVLAVLSGIAREGSPEYLRLAIMLAAMVGAVQVIMGCARMGFLVNFLSRPVLRGFTTGAPIIIMVSQLKHLLGVELPQSQRVWEVLGGLPAQMSAVHLPTVALGLVAVILQVALKRWRPRWPHLLIMVAAITFGVWLFRLDQHGIRVVGDVPRGLPMPSLPLFDPARFWQLLPSAIAIALIGYMEGISIAKIYAERYRHRLNESQELVALGLGNLGASVMQGYPIGGSFARTAVNEQAGARTPLANLIAALTVILTLVFLSDLFFFLPKAVLASVVLVAVFKLIEFKEMRLIFSIKRVDGVLAVVTFVATLLFGALWGLGVGVLASFFPILLRTSRPHLVELGEMPDGHEFRDVLRFPRARRLPGVLLLRIDSSFSFLNASFLRDRITQAVLAQPLHTVILDASGMNDLDTTAYGVLERILEALQARSIRLYMVGVKGPLRDTLKSGGLVEKLGPDRLFHSPAAAVNHLRRTTHLLEDTVGGGGI